MEIYIALQRGFIWGIERSTERQGHAASRESAPQKLPGSIGSRSCAGESQSNPSFSLAQSDSWSSDMQVEPKSNSRTITRQAQMESPSTGELGQKRVRVSHHRPSKPVYNIVLLRKPPEYVVALDAS